MVDLSVIIPVYKVDEYLERCVNSVLGKNIPDMEILLVDDGSPDGSAQLCSMYAQQSPSVKIIHKTNGGLSSARNAGILASAGKYLMFLDSDDWWNPDVDMNRILAEVKAHPETEMFLLTSIDYIEGEGYFSRKEHDNLPSIRTDSVAHYYSDLLANGNLEVHAATKILKRSFLTENKLFFREGITAEDNEWMIRMLRSLRQVRIINEPVYVYQYGRTGSISNSISPRNINDLLGIVHESLSYYSDYPTGELKNQELCFASYLWFCALGLSCHLTGDEIREIKGRFLECKAVCDYSNSPKTKLCNNVMNVLGFDLTRRILGLYIRGKNRINFSKQTNQVNP